MTASTKAAPAQRMTLAADTAADLMTPNLISIRAEATVREAVALLTDKGFSAAPVIDQAGRAAGVVSRADIIVHDRARQEHDASAAAQGTADGEAEGALADTTLVRDIMTPAVFSVRPTTPVSRVVGEMVALRIHQLFVVDEAGLLVGVISTMDVLRALRE